mmetsp:Transcript_3273/g.9511  ORF Transcript_3273/g.9511 Transcript_3273/m.9511 type:complete len:255 (-) Transcript_3273:54-818(-)
MAVAVAATPGGVDDGKLLFMENEHYALVDALPYIDTQLGSMEVAQQVKALIDEEMTLFEPRDYLEGLPAPELPLLSGEAFQKEFERIEAGAPFQGVDIYKYTVEEPKGPAAQDHVPWRKAAEGAQLQLEYNRLRLVNLEMLERWGGKAWIAHTAVVRATEGILAKEAAELRASREEVNKKRKLEHVSCGNELRRLANELDRYRTDNMEVERGLMTLEVEVQHLRTLAIDRGIDIDDVDPEYASMKKARLEEEAA